MISAAWTINKIEIVTGAEKLKQGDSFTAEIKALRHALEHTCNLLGITKHSTNNIIKWPSANPMSQTFYQGQMPR